MQTPNYTIRPLKPEEMHIPIEWAATEGWNPGLHDADTYYTADPNGFLVGFLDDQPIAVISAVAYGASYGFVGFYIVKPAYRGQGYGIRIWNAALDYLKGRTIGLDGVVEQQENYKKSGFKLAYRNIRFEGHADPSVPTHPDIVELSTLPFELIDAYDQPFSPDDRTAFLKTWIHQPECHALGIMQDEKLSGYGIIRPCRSGYKIGPLFADTPEQAESLFQALQGRVEPNALIYLDVPEVNREATALAERHHMTVSFETARMYSGPAPELPLDRIYGITSFEIG